MMTTSNTCRQPGVLQPTQKSLAANIMHSLDDPSLGVCLRNGDLVALRRAANIFRSIRDNFHISDRSYHTISQLLLDAIEGYEQSMRNRSEHECNRVSWLTPLEVEMKSYLEVYRNLAVYLTYYHDHYKQNPNLASILATVNQKLQRLCPRINNLAAAAWRPPRATPSQKSASPGRARQPGVIQLPGICKVKAAARQLPTPPTSQTSSVCGSSTSSQNNAITTPSPCASPPTTQLLSPPRQDIKPCRSELSPPPTGLQLPIAQIPRPQIPELQNVGGWIEEVTQPFSHPRTDNWAVRRQKSVHHGHLGGVGGARQGKRSVQLTGTGTGVDEVYYLLVPISTQTTGYASRNVASGNLSGSMEKSCSKASENFVMRLHLFHGK
ncbi:hypothetical protein B0H66DRAFT_590717 [Apodospora peruviana]|uniref:Uncharacterized protein n=1 Tax=Apodospora peruviana TaxID=516989 RepID=A0AAE0I3V3_9PEZI|nr:hypothetical protein B0H66DRAFT_596281 [Apodospora peruviana]KAK3317940.1 hypothetical protein B0H66DRAFT_590717 [Apodospora peruviana]